VKVLLDEDLPHKLRMNLPGHDTSTVAYLGWNGLKNGDLLSAAEGGNFEVFVTGDQNLRHQQNLRQRRLAIVVLSAQDWPTLKGNLTEIASAVDQASIGSFRFVECK
jgi:predicted nuclease of predicted toxin-antitoxin system